MLKKHSFKKGEKNINLILGRNTYTDYNSNKTINHNKNSVKEKIHSTNDNNRVHSLFESPKIKKNTLTPYSNYPLGLSYQDKAYTQPTIIQSPKLNTTNSTDFSHIKIKNTKQILSKLKKIIFRIKNKKKRKLNEYNNNFSDNILFKNSNRKEKLKNNYTKSPENQHNYSKTFTKFESQKNKNKYKELRFKVHNTIKSNIHPLCNNYINKAHIFNEKILEYYQSDHFINLIRNFHNNFHYKLNLEPHPKIKMYTDIKSLEKDSKTNKLDFKKCFSEREQKLILLDPAYYFQKDNPDSFINVNIAKKKSLADRIKEEDEEEQIKQILNNYLFKKNKGKTRNIKIRFDTSDSKKRIITKVNKILSYKKKKKIKNLENLDLKDIPQEESDKNEEVNTFKNDEKYDFFQTYKNYIKESYVLASHINKTESKKYNKKDRFNSGVDDQLRECILQLNYIYKDKLLQKKAKDKVYYDKAKDEKNKFNIFTKQMLVEQNYEYLRKIKRKIDKINKIEGNKNKGKGKKDDDEEKDDNTKKDSIKKDNKNDLSDNREKKLINLHINKIKLIYKQK